MKIAQGAEAIIEKKGKIVLKRRIPKSYRIKEIDEELRKHRTRAEAKNLEKVREIVNVPKVIDVDKKEAIISMEFIDGDRLSQVLEKADYKKIAKILGRDIAKLHDNNIIHGDLTTSNFILKKKEKKERYENNKEIYFIDFGLSFHSTKDEDKAVDLHVLREALESKHYTIWKEVYDLILYSYKKESKNSIKVIKRLEDVELRGRNKNKHG